MSGAIFHPMSQRPPARSASLGPDRRMPKSVSSSTTGGSSASKASPVKARLAHNSEGIITNAMQPMNLKIIFGFQKKKNLLKRITKRLPTREKKMWTILRVPCPLSSRSRYRPWLKRFLNRRESNRPNSWLFALPIQSTGPSHSIRGKRSQSRKIFGVARSHREPIRNWKSPWQSVRHQLQLLQSIHQWFQLSQQLSQNNPIKSLNSPLAAHQVHLRTIPSVTFQSLKLLLNAIHRLSRRN